MNFDDCKQLFQLTVLNDDFLINWVPLVTSRPGSPTNCGANTLCFLNLVDRQASQQLSIESETGVRLGMPYAYITEIIKKKVSDDMVVTENEYDIKDLVCFFKQKLNKNSITILNLKRADKKRHILTIVKSHAGILVIFNPKKKKYYSEPTTDFQFKQENLYTYIYSTAEEYSKFSAYCGKSITLSELQSEYNIANIEDTEQAPATPAAKRRKIEGGKKSKKRITKKGKRDANKTKKNKRSSKKKSHKKK